MPLASVPGGLVKLNGNWMMVGNVGVVDGDRLAEDDRHTRRRGDEGEDVAALGSASTVEKLTGLLKVTVIAPGVTVTVEPLAGLVDATRSTSTALMASMALIRP